MLWTDRYCVTSADLAQVDNDAVISASVEAVSLDALIARSLDAAGHVIVASAQAFGGGSYDLHSAAVHYTGVRSHQRRARLLLGQVITSGATVEWSHLKNWLVYRCLEALYRDMANRTNTGGDRYRERQESYREVAAGEAWHTLWSVGIPVVRNPLPCPGAILEPGSGTWSDAALSTVAGSGTQSGSYQVAITWLNADGVESTPSSLATVTLASGQVLRVSIASLVPPNGTQSAHTRALARVDPLIATGWRVYAAPAGGTLVRQSDGSPGVGTSLITLPGNVSVSGTPLPIGQPPDYYAPLARLVERG